VVVQKGPELYIQRTKIAFIKTTNVHVESLLDGTLANRGLYMSTLKPYLILRITSSTFKVGDLMAAFMVLSQSYIAGPKSRSRGSSIGNSRPIRCVILLACGRRSGGLTSANIKQSGSVESARRPTTRALMLIIRFYNGNPLVLILNIYCVICYISSASTNTDLCVGVEVFPNPHA
jgi:hypothetical protein